MSNHYRDGAYNKQWSAAENTTPPPEYPATPLGLIPSQAQGGNPNGGALRDAAKVAARLTRWPHFMAWVTTELEARATVTWCFGTSTSAELAAEVKEIADLLAPDTGEVAA